MEDIKRHADSLGGDMWTKKTQDGTDVLSHIFYFINFFLTINSV